MSSIYWVIYCKATLELSDKLLLTAGKKKRENLLSDLNILTEDNLKIGIKCFKLTLQSL